MFLLIHIKFILKSSFSLNVDNEIEDYNMISQLNLSNISIQIEN